MSNPARLLADQLAAWAIPEHVTSEQARGSDNNSVNGRPFWSRHGMAARWLADVERAIDSAEANGESVDHYRDTVPAWYQAVWSYTAPWGKVENHARALLAPSDLRLLEALAGHIDATGYVPAVDADHLEELRQTFEEAEDLIRATSAVPADFRRYLIGLVAEARMCVADYQTFGSVELRSIALELGGAMSAASGLPAMPAPEQAKWKRVVGAILLGLAIHGGEMAIDAVPDVIRSITAGDVASTPASPPPSP